MGTHESKLDSAGRSLPPCRVGALQIHSLAKVGENYFTKTKQNNLNNEVSRLLPQGYKAGNRTWFWERAVKAKECKNAAGIPGFSGASAECCGALQPPWRGPLCLQLWKTQLYSWYTVHVWRTTQHSYHWLSLGCGGTGLSTAYACDVWI